MKNLLDYSDLLHIGEAMGSNPLGLEPDWKEGGILFIKGLPLPDGMPRLYAGRVEKIWKKEGGPYMAKITPEGFYIILKDGYDYVANKIGTSPRILSVLGLSSHVIGLNAKTGKTPLWQDTVTKFDFKRLLKEYSPVLDGLTDLSFYPLSMTRSFEANNTTEMPSPAQSGWKINDESLYKKFVFKNFEEAFDFMKRVAYVAKEMNHHPKWTNVYKTVEIWLRTHSENDSITEKDQKLARAIEEIASDYQVVKK
jgi:4a-hydroxytetrahydrobiopterin dehydratase